PALSKRAEVELRGIRQIRREGIERSRWEATGRVDSARWHVALQRVSCARLRKPRLGERASQTRSSASLQKNFMPYLSDTRFSPTGLNSLWTARLRVYEGRSRAYLA